MLHAFCYHRVVEDPVASDCWDLVVTRACFAEQLEALTGRMTLLDLARVSLDEALQSSQEYALITFDDIYHDVVTCALPVLEAFGASALLFIAGGYLGETCFWWDQLEAIYSHGHQGDQNAAITSTWQWLRDRSLEEKLLVVNHMARLQPAASVPPGCRPLNPVELKALSEHPSVRFGGHTMTHPWMPALHFARMRQEIEAGTELLRQLTGQQPMAFAYPFGAWNRKARRAVARSGYPLAFTTERPSPFPTEPGHVDRLAFPRLVVKSWSASELLARLN